MTANERNKHGLYDVPVRDLEREQVILAPEDIDERINEGAFMMTREKAVSSGFLHPHDEQETVIAFASEEV